MGPLLAVAICCVGVIVSFQLADGLTFFADEWNIILRPGWSADSLLEPLNEHIYVGPVVIYKLLLAAFGLDSTAPFRFVDLLLVAVIAGLVFVFVRERLGDAVALIVAAVLVLLGPSWENLLWGAGISFMGSTAAGVGALMCLGETRIRRADAWACGLLVVSLAFSSLGLVFALGAAADVLLRPDRRSRAWVPIVPFVLYVVWYAAYGHEAESAVSADNLYGAPLYVFDSAGSALASFLGLSGVGPGKLGVDPDHARPLLVVALVVAVIAVVRDRALLSIRLWVLIVTALAFWGSAALNEIPGREPGASRYQLIGAVLVVMIAAELLRGRRPGRGWVAVAALLAAAVIVSNLNAMRGGEQFFRERSDEDIVALAALQGGREAIDPDAVIPAGAAGSPFPEEVRLGDYYDAVDDWGSPAADYQQLIAGAESGREAADQLLARAYGLAPQPSTAPAGDEGCAPGVASPAGLEFPTPSVVIDLPDGAGDVRLGRFADRATVELGPLEPGAYGIEVPGDAFDAAWRVQVAGAPAARICAAEPG